MEYNDYELVSLAQEGNEEAIDIIYKKYKPIIVKKSKNAILYASHHGIDINDIMQEGYIGLDEAIKGFSQDDKATFYTFANLCIDREIVNYLRKTTRGKNKLLNEAVAIDEGLENVISDEMDIESSFILKDNEKKFMIEIYEELTKFEKEVFDLKIKGYNFEEIANILDRDVKSIYNTFHRIKQKSKKIMETED
ncbi:MAG: sigma-70 family RNA polymerase sigma factor [Bacilli bacterium]